MNDTLPAVSVWKPLTGSTWAKVGILSTYSSLQCQPRFLDVGTWQLEIPYDAQALAVQKDRLLTFDWRGKRIMTGSLSRFNPKTDEETGQPVLSLTGSDAFGMLGRAVAYPDPTLGIGSQPAAGVYTGVGETVVMDMIRQNLMTRYGAAISVPASAGAGSAITARTRFQNLLQLVQKKAKLSGIGIRVGLVDTGSTRATLTVSAFVPQDKTLRVRLSHKTGALRDWSQEEQEPSATKAIVGGAGEGVDRVFRVRTTPESVAAATDWGGHREVFVEGPDSFDNTELDEAGDEALESGAQTVNLSLTAAETEGLLAFRDYAPGDKATAEILTGLSIVDVITSVEVRVDENGVDVVPTFGDPDAKKPALQMAQLVRAVRRDVKNLQTRR